MNDNPAAPAPGHLYDTEAAAALLGLHPKTVERMARNKEIDHYRVGRHLRFSDTHIATYLASREVTRHTSTERVA